MKMALKAHFILNLTQTIQLIIITLKYTIMQAFSNGLLIITMVVQAAAEVERIILAHKVLEDLVHQAKEITAVTELILILHLAAVEVVVQVRQEQTLF